MVLWLSEFLFFSIGLTIITMRSFPWDTNRILGLNGEPLAIKENMYKDVMDIPARWECSSMPTLAFASEGACFLRRRIPLKISGSLGSWGPSQGCCWFFWCFSVSLSFNQISIGNLGAFRHLLLQLFFRSVFLYWTSARKMASLFKPMAQCSLEPQQT